VVISILTKSKFRIQKQNLEPFNEGWRIGMEKLGEKTFD
jgi:hypothetical protein